MSTRVHRRNLCKLHVHGSDVSECEYVGLSPNEKEFRPEGNRKHEHENGLDSSDIDADFIHDINREAILENKNKHAIDLELPSNILRVSAYYGKILDTEKSIERHFSRIHRIVKDINKLSFKGEIPSTSKPNQNNTNANGKPQHETNSTNDHNLNDILPLLSAGLCATIANITEGKNAYDKLCTCDTRLKNKELDAIESGIARIFVPLHDVLMQAAMTLLKASEHPTEYSSDSPIDNMDLLRCLSGIISPGKLLQAASKTETPGYEPTNEEHTPTNEVDSIGNKVKHSGFASESPDENPDLSTDNSICNTNPHANIKENDSNEVLDDSGDDSSILSDDIIVEKSNSNLNVTDTQDGFRKDMFETKSDAESGGEKYYSEDYGIHKGSASEEKVISGRCETMNGEALDNGELDCIVDSVARCTSLPEVHLSPGHLIKARDEIEARAVSLSQQQYYTRGISVISNAVFGVRSVTASLFNGIASIVLDYGRSVKDLLSLTHCIIINTFFRARNAITNAKQTWSTRYSAAIADMKTNLLVKTEMERITEIISKNQNIFKKFMITEYSSSKALVTQRAILQLISKLVIVFFEEVMLSFQAEKYAIIDHMRVLRELQERNPSDPAVDYINNKYADIKRKLHEFCWSCANKADMHMSRVVVEFTDNTFK